MEIQERNGIQTYNLTSTPILPTFISERHRRNLSKRDATVRHRIELLQDFDFPTASQKLVQSPDAKYILACGTYKPRVKCFDLYEMSMKWERYVDAHIVDMACLSSDWGKMALLCDDRNLVFHEPYGHHTKIRIPHFGRCMTYQDWDCNLVVGCCSSARELYRLDLEEGRFQSPLKVDGEGDLSVNCVGVSPVHCLLGAGCDDGVMRFYDTRSGNTEVLQSFLRLDVGKGTDAASVESMAFDESGTHMVCGTGDGKAVLYDMRSSQPLHIQEHSHALPIHTVRFHTKSDCVVSSDAKLIKIWNAKKRQIVTNIEGSADFHHFILCGDEYDPNGNSSGLILCAGEQPRMSAYYCPALGTVPKWCSFLESITEELQEHNPASSDPFATSAELFQDYKFITREDVDKLGIANLVGTPFLKGYMHGFFMDHGLYNKVRSVSNPFEYEQYRKQKIKTKLEEKRASRIAPTSSKQDPNAVNRELRDRLQSKIGLKSGKDKILAETMLQDSRFQQLFSNKDYEIDEDDENFKLRNPSGVAAMNAMRKERRDYSDEESGDDEEEEEEVGFEKVLPQGEDEEWGHEDDEAVYHDTSSDDDGFAHAKVRGEKYKEMKSLTTKKQKPIMYEIDSHTNTEENILQMGVSGDAKSAKSKAKKRKQSAELPLEQRLLFIKQKEEELGGGNIRTKGNEKELTYVPKDVREKERRKKEKVMSIRKKRR